MNLDNLFVVEDDIPYVSKEARNIDCLYKIITRDSGKIVSVAGEKKRVKAVSRKELAFIYFYLNKEQFANYQKGKERESAIKKRLAIDWELDELVWKAIKELEEDFVTVQKKLIVELRNTLFNYVNMAKLMGQKSEELISRFVNLDTATLTDEQVVARNAMIATIQEDVASSLKITKDLKDAFKNLDELEVQDKAGSRRQKSDKLQVDRSMYKRREPDV